LTDYKLLLDDIAEAAREAGEAILEIVRRGFDVEQSRTHHRSLQRTGRRS
jgi:hypothetical protein